MVWWLEGATSRNFGWVQNPIRSKFFIFFEPRNKSEKKKKFSEISGKIGDFFPIFFSSDFFQCKFFQSRPKTDFSAINRPKNPIFCSMVATHIKALIQAQFTLTTAAIQESVIEKWGYQISYKKVLDGKYKAIRQLFGDFSQSYTELPRLFLAIEQANPECVVIWKTCEINMPNTEIFQRVFWSFKPSIEGFQHCRPIMSIDGTHLCGKYKGKLLIAMGCDGNNQLFPLTFAIT